MLLTVFLIIICIWIFLTLFGVGITYQIVKGFVKIAKEEDCTEISETAEHDIKFVWDGGERRKENE